MDTIEYVPTTDDVRRNMAFGVSIAVVVEQQNIEPWIGYLQDIDWPKPGLRENCKAQFDRWLAHYTETLTGYRTDPERVQNGVCLVCGGAVLNAGAHLDMDRHDIAVGQAAKAEALREVGEMLRNVMGPGPFSPEIGDWLIKRAHIEKGDK